MGTFKDDIKESLDQLKTADEIYSNYKNMIESTIQVDGFKKELLDDESLMALSIDNIVNGDISKIDKILDKYIEPDTGIDKMITDVKENISSVVNEKDSTYAIISRILAPLRSTGDFSDLKSDEISNDIAKRIIISSPKKSQLELISLSSQLNDVQASVEDLIRKKREFVVSSDARKSRDEVLNKLETEYNELTDTVEKAKKLREINLLKDIISMDFVSRRVNNIGAKEIKSILRSFFVSITDNSYLMERFNNKIPKFGFTTDVFKKLLNLEERYLDEEYWAYNNLFLFNYIRFVAHASPYSNTDKEYVKVFTNMMLALVYHEFTDDEAEEEMKNVIRTFDDNFKDYYQEFLDKNLSYPKSKERLDSKTKMDNKIKMKLLNKLLELDPENTLGYNSAMTYEELLELFKTFKKSVCDNNEDDWKEIMEYNESRLAKYEPISDEESEDSDTDSSTESETTDNSEIIASEESDDDMSGESTSPQEDNNE